MTSPARGTSQQDMTVRLFEPGERVGWEYLERERLMWPPATDPPPFPQLPTDVQAQLNRARQAMVKYQRSGLVAGAGCAMLVNPFMLVGYFIAKSNATRRLRDAEQAYRDAAAQTDQRRREVFDAWKAQEHERERAERDRVSALPAWWGAVPRAAASRMEIFGGNGFGWEAFVTVFGSSCLGSGRSLLVIDYSEDEVAAELSRLAGAAGKRVDEQALPTDLDRCGLLAGLDGQELADALVEGLHRDDVTADRGARAMDARILETVCAALAPGVTAGKLTEAMLALMNEPARPSQLTSAQWEQVATELFSASYVQQAHDRFQQIHAYLSPLAAIGIRQEQPGPAADLVRVTFEPGMSTARLETLTDLTMGWITRAVNTRTAQPDILVIAGADKATRGQLEKLSEACGRRGVRLVYLFRHLREASLSLIGGGVVGFMQLGNHVEATQAADFIGREHSFKISQLTKTTGGSQTHTRGETVSGGQSTGSGYGPGGGTGHSGSSRTWGSSVGQEVGANWSESTGSQRVYEYRMEPSAIQGLPDYAMILVEPGPNGPTFKAIDVNPDIATRPDTTARPIPEEYPAAMAEAEQARERNEQEWREAFEKAKQQQRR